MIYRKASALQPKLLLRIVATAGAGALLGMAACSSGHTCQGLCVSGDDNGAGSGAAEDDAAADSAACGFGGCGLTANPLDASDDASDATGFCCGVVDAGGDDADWSDADSRCPLVCGSVLAPPDGGDASPSCVRRCDVIVGLLPPPGDR